jgi:hypothetical protein
MYEILQPFENSCVEWTPKLIHGGKTPDSILNYMCGPQTSFPREARYVGGTSVASKAPCNDAA